MEWASGKQENNPEERMCKTKKRTHGHGQWIWFECISYSPIVIYRVHMKRLYSISACDFISKNKMNEKQTQS